jgi:hypothetical protein
VFDGDGLTLDGAATESLRKEMAAA